MPDKLLYEYSVIRVLPKVERDEFVNVGVILFCKSAKLIQMRFHINEQRLVSFCPEIDIEQIRKNLESFESISMGSKNAGPIAEFDVPSRFRWLTSIRSSMIQTSRPHPGMCDDLAQTFERIFAEMVL